MEAEPYLSEALKDFRITIAGKGEDLTKYKGYMIDSKNYEIINTFIPDERVAELFQKASIVVLPYVDASQSGVVPLAFAFGKPVVVTRVGSIPEVVDQGEDGFIVKPRDSRALAEAIISILRDPSVKQRMSENARTKADTELSWSRVAEMHRDAYVESVNRFSENKSL
jgi:starch synthase